MLAARPAARLIIEYGDYGCPYSRQAFHAIERAEQQLGGNVRFAFRHFPLTGIHPHALAAAAAAEAAARQGRTPPPDAKPAWRPADGDQKPRRSLTMIAVTRPGVITLLMMRMLFTPLGTP